MAAKKRAAKKKTSVSKKTTSKKKTSKKKTPTAIEKGDGKRKSGERVSSLWPGYKKGNRPMPASLDKMPEFLPAIPDYGSCGKVPKDVADERKRHFLAAMQVCGNLGGSAACAGIPRQLAMYWRKKDEEFSQAWDDAYYDAIDTLEQEAVRRGRDGTEKRIWYKGLAVGSEKEYSDQLLRQVLSAHNDRYRDKVEHSTPKGQPMEINDGRAESRDEVMAKILAMIPNKEDPE